MIKIASHNSFTCYPAKGWLSKLFLFAGRCQRVSIRDQYMKYGVRMFDLRIYPKSSIDFDIRHGFVKFDKTNLQSDLENLAWMNDTYVRVILEQNSPERDSNRQNKIESDFCNILHELVISFPGITFIGGYRKYDWKKLINLSEGPSMTDKYSSTTDLIGGKDNNYWTAKLDDWFPYLYAKLMNKKNLHKKYETEYLMIDFVDIR